MRAQAMHDIEMDKVCDECTLPAEGKARDGKLSRRGLETVCERSRKAETHEFERLPAVERQA